MEAKNTIQYWDGYKEGKGEGEELGYKVGKKAGIREVMEWVNDNHGWYTGEYMTIKLQNWRDYLKELGLEEE